MYVSVHVDDALLRFDFSFFFVFVLALNHHQQSSATSSMCQIGTSSDENEHTRMSPTDPHPVLDESLQRHHDMKYFVDLSTAALHLR